MNTKKETNCLSVPLYAVIIFIIILTFLSLKLYDWSLKYTNLSNDIEENNNSYIENNNESNINLIEDELEEVENTKDLKGNQIIQEKNIIEPKTYTYTADNGNTYDIVGTIKIPTINVEYPILATTSDELLKISVTKYWGSNPNEVGNMVILGHNYKNNKFFGNLSKLNIGENIQITDLNNKTLKYTVYKTDIIEDDDNTCTSQKTNGNIEITLITCYYEKENTHATKRFIVKARAN